MRNIGVLLLAFLISNSVFSQVGIGTDSPDNSAALDIESTTLGFLPPRMSSVQRDAIAVTSTSIGLIIFNTDSNVLNIFDGVTWHAIVTSQDPIICTNATTLAEFLTCIQTNYTPDQTLGYAPARDVLYSAVDVDLSTQELKGIYSDYKLSAVLGL